MDQYKECVMKCKERIKKWLNSCDGSSHTDMFVSYGVVIALKNMFETIKSDLEGLPGESFYTATMLNESCSKGLIKAGEELKKIPAMAMKMKSN